MVGRVLAIRQMKTTKKPLSIHILNDRMVIGGVSTIIQMLVVNLASQGNRGKVWINEDHGAIQNPAKFNRIGFGLRGYRKILTILLSPFPVGLIAAVMKDKAGNNSPVIHLNTPYIPTAVSAICAALITRTRLIYTVHANKSHISKLHWLVEQLIFLFSSSFVLELRASQFDYRKKNKKTISFIPFGVDSSKVERKWAARGQGPFAFIAINRLDKNRMTDVFIKAFAKRKGNDDSILHIVGDGAEKDALVKLAFDLGAAEKITFSSSISENAIQEVLGHSDCFLTLSARGDVGMTGKLAAGTGIPIIAYEFDSNEECFYSANSVEGLSAKMSVLSGLSSGELIEYAGKTKSLLYSDSRAMMEGYSLIYGRNSN